MFGKKYNTVYFDFYKTRDVNKKDFNTITCYYFCNEKECDFTQCEETAGTIEYPSISIENVVKDVLKDMKETGRVREADGCHIKYKDILGTHNLLNIMRLDAKKKGTTLVLTIEK